MPNKQPLKREITYYFKFPEEVKYILKLKTMPKLAKIQVEFEVTDDAQQGQFINLIDEELVCLVGEDGVEFRPKLHDQIILWDECIDFEELDNLCLKEWRKEYA